MRRTDQPPHVLMTADAVGGVWTYAVELCRQLDAREIGVTLAVMGPPPSAAQRADITRIPGVQMHTHPGRLEWMEDPWSDVEAAGEWLGSLEQQVQPDVIHLNGFALGARAWRAPHVVVGHSCVLSWWRQVKRERPPSRWDTYAAKVRNGLRGAAAVVAPSWTMLQWLEELYGPLPGARAISNGCRPATEAMRKEPLILAAGRLWDEAKNVSVLCDVAPSLPWPVAVAGDGDPEGLRASGVEHLGRLASGELRRWMARASIYALPARYEPFGLSVLEAALGGCALVLGDIPTLREIWADTAVYVDPDDTVALRSAIHALITDDTRRARLAAAARQRAALLTPDRMADDYCALYSELIRERRSLLSLSAV
jgi:glycosyltransferase involved in cell wall biosynthesis